MKKKKKKNKNAFCGCSFKWIMASQLVMIQRTSTFLCEDGGNTKKNKGKIFFFFLLFLTNFEVFRAQKLESDPLF